ncbi:hypothetical protein AB6867_26290 [Serratia proteamaculans]|uniref:hypothetical protein n=1 Tax=Serratia proteamaculans TaxID=28151 RepID=UPI0039BE016D
MSLNTLTKNDINADLAMILDSVKITNTPIPLASEAIRIAIKIPALLALPGVFICLVRLFLKEDIEGELWLLMFHSVVFLAFSLITYSSALLYLSIPFEVRGKSVFINEIKSKILHFSRFLIIINFIAVMMSFAFPIMIVISPGLCFVGNMIIRIYIGLEVSRYGAASMIEKIGGVVKSI